MRRIEAERSLKRLGLSKKAVKGLISAGVSGPETLVSVPWTDEEAKARFSSLRWRLSVDPNCGPKTVAEVERLRVSLLSERSAGSGQRLAG
ncbi:MAG TPA: hypothetical protein VL358_14065 [Caulobacteraceae bacterium]|nr:hypothetical protein [Caulobacteraceae bacterium]